MPPFDYQPRTRIVFGPDQIDRLGELAGELGARRALVVSDPGIIAAGHTARGVAALEQAGIETHVFDGVAENPTDQCVEAGVAVAKRHQSELLVGLGGGSSMDCAKGINFVVSCRGRIQDYWGVGKALYPMLPMIAVPTTAGTGSKTQSFALITDSQTHMKMACGDKKASFRIAILDPTLTVTQPPRVTALTGIDAIAHALETYVTSKRNAVSLAFSRESWQLLAENFGKVLADPANLEARGGMLLGACFAGLAIENSMLGATHALANPLTAHFGIVHGQAIGLMLPHVIRFNGVLVDGWYRELLEYVPGTNGAVHSAAGGTVSSAAGGAVHSAAGGAVSSAAGGAVSSAAGGAVRRPKAAEALAEVVAELVDRAGLPRKLSQCGVDEGKLDALANDAAGQWTGEFNPRKVGVKEYLGLYRAAW